ncbi:MAG: DUF262 domain-containing protein [Deltaproteobacteria bacterium]|nr:DUF262 domain-containing protein [Deltaproteobacteria bacterium]
MIAKQAYFLAFLGDSDQLAIPIYQRTYSWERDECLQLWNDLVGLVQRPAGDEHFVGSIVYIGSGTYQVTGVNPLEVIDGQQRLTTISLLLLALARAIDTSTADGAKTAKKLMQKYLVRDDEESQREPARYKLLLTKGDRETYMRLVDGQQVDARVAPRLLDAYTLFVEQIRRTPLTTDELIAGLERLMMVDISLNRQQDNPQLIFESLNSTGRDLSHADLIRNYVLMGQPAAVQADIYQNSWFPLEQSFPADQQEMFDRFARDYLIMKTGRIPKIDRVYETYKGFAQGSELGLPELVADLFRHSKNWVRLALDEGGSAALDAALADVRTLHVDVAYPFLMEAMDDRDQGLLTDAELVDVVRLVESYVFRRALAGVPTNILNKTFAALAGELDKSNYLESLEAALLLKEAYARMPNDEEVANALRVKDVYNFRNRNYLLSKLENYGRKEAVNVTEYTIEHVMPQRDDVTPEWQEELGPEWQQVHAKYLHTLGNLTLTGYNSELSSRPFREKQTMEGGFKDSPIRLNQSLAGLDHWNEQEIQNRAEDLIKLVLQVWPAPHLPEEVLAKYRKPQVVDGRSVDDLEMAPDTRSLFDELRRRVLNLDAGVQENVRKTYVGYRMGSNFLEVVPLARGLKLFLDIAFGSLSDPDGMARDVTGIGHWGTGNTEVHLADAGQVDAVMNLVRQSFERQEEESYQPQWSEAGVERVIAEVADPEEQAAMHDVVASAVSAGLYPRPWKYSVMFAPQANRTRALFTLSLRDGGVELWSSPQAFHEFFGLDPDEVSTEFAPEGAKRLGNSRDITDVATRLEALMLRTDSEIGEGDVASA